MKELSVFVDESGDFGDYEKHAPYYIVAMLFHNQERDISSQIKRLDGELSYLKLDDLCIHTGPIIRKEEIYQNMSIVERRRVFNKITAFIKSVDVTFKTFSIEKRRIADSVEAAGKLSRQISQFIREHYEFFLGFETIKIYYDNGQIELSKILSSVFNALLPNSVFRKVMPSDYKLFQAADFLCTMSLVKLKLETNALSKSELNFFGNARDLKRNYLKALAKKEFK